MFLSHNFWGITCTLHKERINNTMSLNPFNPMWRKWSWENRERVAEINIKHNSSGIQYSILMVAALFTPSSDRQCKIRHWDHAPNGNWLHPPTSWRMLFILRISNVPIPPLYRVTHQVGKNLLLTLIWKSCFFIRSLYYNATFKLMSTGGFYQPDVSPCTTTTTKFPLHSKKKIVALIAFPSGQLEMLQMLYISQNMKFA